MTVVAICVVGCCVDARRNFVPQKQSLQWIPITVFILSIIYIRRHYDRCKPWATTGIRNHHYDSTRASSVYAREGGQIEYDVKFRT